MYISPIKSLAILILCRSHGYSMKIGLDSFHKAWMMEYHFRSESVNLDPDGMSGGDGSLHFSIYLIYFTALSLIHCVLPSFCHSQLGTDPLY